MSEYACTVTRNPAPRWDGIAEPYEFVAELFADAEDVGWFTAHFPFMWSTGEGAGDGEGGPPVENPLEFRVSFNDFDERSAVTRSYDLAALLLLDAEDHQLPPTGEYPDQGAKEWAEKTAAALEQLAARIRAPLLKT